MISSIGPINAPNLNPSPVQAPGESSRPGAFQNVLEKAINQVDGMRASANQSVERFLAGEGEELHSVAMATQRAELAFELFMQVRNKVVQAYQEVMRMQM